jgi:hypothetical protein
MERRITLRMLSYWEKLRQNRPMPTAADVSPEGMGDLWDSCFMLYFNGDSTLDYEKTYMGKVIVDAYRHGLNEEDDPLIISPDISRFVLNHHKILDMQKPILEQGEFPSFLLGTVKYRQCLLPLGENGKVTAILGGMHFKNFLPEPIKIRIV